MGGEGEKPTLFPVALTRVGSQERSAARAAVGGARPRSIAAVSLRQRPAPGGFGGRDADSCSGQTGGAPGPQQSFSFSCFMTRHRRWEKRPSQQQQSSLATRKGETVAESSPAASVLEIERAFLKGLSENEH